MFFGYQDPNRQKSERAAEILVAASKLLSASWNPLKRNDVEWTPKFVESRNALHTLLNKLEQTP